MEIKQLEYFQTLCKELHFTRAAEKLNISQPSLSQQIRILESEIGMPLFDRIGKKIRITETGELLLKHSQKIFLELETIRNSIDDLNNLETGKVSIGALLGVVTYLLPPAIIQYHNLYPKVELSVFGLRSGEIKERLLKGEFDLGIFTMDNEHKELDSIPLYTENLSLVVPSTHELANEESLSLDVLKNTSNILLPNNYFSRQSLNQYCQSLGFELHSFLEMTNIESIVAMVAHQAGVTVLPTPYVKLKQSDKIKFIPIIDPIPQREIGLFYVKDKYMNTATRAFIDQLLDNIHL